MESLKSEGIRGNWATLLLAWNEDDSLDLARVRAELEALVAYQVNGIYSCGTAGDFHSLTEAEFDALSALLAESCASSCIPFQIGASHMSAQISLERVRRTVPLAPAAFQVILPDWYPVTDVEAVAFLQRLAEVAGGIGLVLYNPPHAKRVLTVEELAALSAAVPELVGVKTAGGDVGWYAEMRKHLSHLSIFVPGHRLATGIREGASGAYSNVACLHPGAAQQWYHQMSTDMDGALELESRLYAFIMEHIVPFITEKGYSPAACDRLLVQIGGWADVGGRMRWPYRAIPHNEAVRLRAVLQESLPEFAM